MKSFKETIPSLGSYIIVDERIREQLMRAEIDARKLNEGKKMKIEMINDEPDGTLLKIKQNFYFKTHEEEVDFIKSVETLYFKIRFGLK